MVKFDLKDFGLSKPKILTLVLTLACEFNLTQSFVYINPYAMQEKNIRQLNKLQEEFWYVARFETFQKIMLKILKKIANLRLVNFGFPVSRGCD